VKWGFQLQVNDLARNLVSLQGGGALPKLAGLEVPVPELKPSWPVGRAVTAIDHAMGKVVAPVLFMKNLMGCAFMGLSRRPPLAVAGLTSDAATAASVRPRLDGNSFLYRFGSVLNRHVRLLAGVTNGVFVPATGPPTDWVELMPAHENRAIFQVFPDERTAIDIHASERCRTQGIKAPDGRTSRRTSLGRVDHHRRGGLCGNGLRTAATRDLAVRKPSVSRKTVVEVPSTTLSFARFRKKLCNTLGLSERHSPSRLRNDIPMMQGHVRSFLALTAILVGAGTTNQVMSVAYADLLYVSLTDDTVARFDVSSGVPATIQASRTTYAAGFSTPTGLVFDESGVLYVANYGNGTIRKVPAGGGASTLWVSGLGQPRGLAFDTAGDLYAANALANAVWKIPASGTGVTQWATGLSGATAVAFDGSGRLYAPNKTGNTVSRVGSSGGAFATWATGLSQPVGIAINANGDAFIPSANTNVISLVTAGGGSPSTWATGFSAPYGVTLDDGGNLFVANGGNNTISKVSPSGTVLYSFSTGAAGPRFIAVVPEPSAPLVEIVAVVAAASWASRRGRRVPLP
jgi:sugar lactone lactonase YvrE